MANGSRPGGVLGVIWGGGGCISLGMELEAVSVSKGLQEKLQLLMAPSGSRLRCGAVLVRQARLTQVRAITIHYFISPGSCMHLQLDQSQKWQVADRIYEP